MKPKTFILAGLCIAFTATINAQIDSFNLSNYKLPVLKRQQLVFDFNFSGNNDYSKSINGSGNGFLENKSNNYGGHLSLNYNAYNNNIKWQKETHVGFNLSPNYYNNKMDTIYKSESYSYSPNISLSSINRNYFQGSTFFESDLDFSLLLGKDYSSSKYSKAKQLNTIGFITIPLKVGKGRIEQVQDARHALYIIDELKKQNRLSNTLTNDDIMKFADFIAEVKNKRFFDSRIREIYEIEAIDSFLFANNFAKNRDARYFTTLNDFWDYGGSPLRNTGTRYSFSIYPGYYYNHYDYSNDSYTPNENKYSVNSLLIYGGLEIVHEKPLNLFWQNTTELNCYFGTMEGKLKFYNSSPNSTLRFPNFQLGLAEGLGYFPNTRTNLTWQVSAKYVKLFDKTDAVKNVIGAEGQGLKLTSFININYYLSQRFRLNFNSSVDYRWQDSKDRVILTFDDIANGQSALDQFYASQGQAMQAYSPKNVNHQFSLGLIYIIF
jgi:hypothetical protein